MEAYLRLGLVLEIFLVGAIVHLVVGGSHPRRLLGVHLGREKNDADRRLARKVQRANLLLTVLGIAAVLLSPEERSAVSMMLVVSLASPVVVTWGYVAVVKTIDRPKVAGRYVVPLDRISARALMSLPLELASFAIIIGTSAAFAAMSSSSSSQLWFILMLMIGYSGLPWLGAWIGARERTALSPNAPEETSNLQLARKQLTVRMIEWMSIGMSVSSAFCWLGLASGNEESAGAVVLGAIVISSVAVIGPLAFYLPPLLEISDRLRELGADRLGTRSDSWRLGGTIYYAPDDPALFVPKSSGIGSTVNFARPGAWFLIGGLVLLPILLALVSLLMLRSGGGS